MAEPLQDPNVPLQPADGNPRFSQRLWSNEVGIAAAESNSNPLTPDPGYEWSNGRKFVAGPGAAG